MSGTDRNLTPEKHSGVMSGPREIIEKLFPKEDEAALRRIVGRCAAYLDGSFAINIAPVPKTIVVREKRNQEEILQHHNQVRPSYNFRTRQITCPSERLVTENPEHPLEPVILEELGHAYLAQERPDIRDEIINIVGAGLTETTALRFVTIQLWNEGVANVFHRIIGASWCKQNATPQATNTLHLSEIYEIDDALRLKRAFRLSDPDRDEVDEIALSRTAAELEELENKAVTRDLESLSGIIATLSDHAGFEAGRNIDDLYRAINELDRISYRTGYVFVKKAVNYLQLEHHYGLAQALDWVIANGPPDKIDDFKNSLAWVKSKLSV